MSKIKFYEGEEIPQEVIEQFPELKLLNSNLINFNNKVTINFVGYLKIRELEIFSYPKHSSKRDDDFKYVIKSILKTSKSKYGLESADKFEINSQFDTILKLYKYYLHYGVRPKKISEKKKSKFGKINFSKTINKVKPTIYKNQIIYDQFIVTKNLHIDDFISQVFAFVLEEKLKQFDFYFPKVRTNINYEEIKKIDGLKIVNELQEIKSKVFRDDINYLLDLLIKYFKETNSQIGECEIVCTSYDKVFEYLVEQYLNKKYDYKFETQKNYYIGKQKLSDEWKNMKIQIDYISIDLKILCDAKYYLEKDSESVDYKQLYYIEFLKKEKVIVDNYWKYYLIKPTKYKKENTVHLKTEEFILENKYLVIDELLKGNYVHE